MAIYGVLVIVLSLLFFIIYLIITNSGVNHQKLANGGKLEKALQAFDDVHIKGGYNKFIIIYALFALSLLIIIVLSLIHI